MCRLLSTAEVCSTVDLACQQSLLDCTNQVVNKNGINHPEFSEDLFKVLLNVMSLAANTNIKNTVRNFIFKMYDFVTIWNRSHYYYIFLNESALYDCILMNYYISSWNQTVVLYTLKRFFGRIAKYEKSRSFNTMHFEKSHSLSTPEERQTSMWSELSLPG